MNDAGEDHDGVIVVASCPRSDGHRKRRTPGGIRTRDLPMTSRALSACRQGSTELRGRLATYGGCRMARRGLD
jgi:hypothetical protein